MANQLIHETSPYLRQHAANPVDWQPWSNAALQQALRENKPVFLSIGYAACHWCHVMAHESFEDQQIADILNHHFIPIKVDREERPDLDSIYMTAVVAMTGHGGWPMSVFLTPSGHPFYGGTYFPPTPRHGLPSFREVLISIAEAWRQDTVKLERSATHLTEYLQQNQVWQIAPASMSDPAGLMVAADQLIASADQQHGGWGTAPKFPSPLLLDFLLRQHLHGHPAALELVTTNLNQMQMGGIFDVVGGGFHRYATDHAWLVPHFEKMLYDNAQLALTYLHAYLITGNPSFRQTCESTLDFLIREMRHPQGGFFSSLDADSEGQEGKVYLWSPEEIRSALSAHNGLEDLVLFAYSVSPSGNFESKTILRRDKDAEEIGRHFSITPEKAQHDLALAHNLLLTTRQSRVQPAADDKILTFWNALTLHAFAEAARYLHRPDYLEIARENASFLLANLHPADRLLRSWREGQARQSAFLEDYAALILALLALYQSSPELNWYSAALNLLEEMIAAFQATDGSFYSSRHDQNDLILRSREIQDNVTPSGNALAARALMQMSFFSGRDDWRESAETLLASIQNDAIRYPSAYAFWLQSLALASRPTDQVALLLPSLSQPPDWVTEQLWSVYRPNLVFAQSTFPPPSIAPWLLQHRPLEQNLPTIYFCRGKTCLPAITNSQDFQRTLSEG